MPEIVLQFSTTKNSWGWRPPFFPNWASWAIRHMSHSPFSHVDMEIPGVGLLGASDSPKALVISGNASGVAVRPDDYEDYGRKFRMVIETPLADDIRAWAMTQLGKPFDDSALYGFLSDALPGQRDWRVADSWFCSELVVWAFEVAGYWPSVPQVWPKNRISPSDMLMLFLFDTRWINRNTFWETGQNDTLAAHVSRRLARMGLRMAVRDRGGA